MAIDKWTSRNETPRPPDAYYLGWILKMAAAATVELAAATQAVYLERLRALSQIEMRTAGERTIREWAEPSKMPPLAFILERIVKQPQLEEYSIPEDWREVARVKLGVSHEQVQEWLEEGKEAQLEYIAKLEADPEWNRMAGQLGAFPGLSRKAPLTFASESQRREWASRKAKEGGWV